MQTQRRNAQMVDLLAGEFQRRYEPNFAWGNVVSMYLTLPGLVGFWPGTVSHNSGGFGRAHDAGPWGLHLSTTNTPLATRRGLVPVCQTLSAYSQVYSILDTPELDLSGTPSYYSSANHGITVGIWCQPYTITGITQYLISKGTASTTNNYRLGINTSAQCFFGIASSSVAYGATNTSQTATTGWQFVCGRFESAASVGIFVNTNYAENTTSIPATADTNAHDLTVGARNNTGTGNFTDYYNGLWGLAFVCSAALSNTHILSLFNHTRALFDV